MSIYGFKTVSRVSRFLAKKSRAWAPILGLIVVFTGSMPSPGQGSKQSVFVSLSIDESRALEDLKQLKKFDLAGVQWKNRLVELIVDGVEFEQLQTLGFPVSFAPPEGSSASSSDPSSDKSQQSLVGYLTPEGVVTALGLLAESYPETVRVFEVGKTTRQRPILGIEISNHLGDPSKPVVLFNGMHHAREVMTTEVLVHMAQTLVQTKDQDSKVKDWLDQMRVVIVPQVNPDGNALVHQGQNMWRKNAWVRQDRVTGVDLNRNYPAYWNHCNGSSGSAGSDVFRGPVAGSEPETKALMALISELKPIADISYHSYGEMIIFPFGCSSVNNLAKELFQSVGQEIKTGLVDDEGNSNTYRLGTAPEILYEADGTDLDWQWQQHGVLAYTIEMNSQGFQPDFKAWRRLTVARQEGGWRALLDRMGKGGFRLMIKSEDLAGISVGIFKNEKNPDKQGVQGGVRWGVRSKAGLVYNLLSPGSYQIGLYRGEQLLKSVEVEVQDELVDLGQIDLQN